MTKDDKDKNRKIEQTSVLKSTTEPLSEIWNFESLDLLYLQIIFIA